MHHNTLQALPAITDRQRQIVELVAAGCSNQEVAQILGISPRTVKAHCDILRQKLGVSRRRELPSAYFRITGIFPLPMSSSTAVPIRG